MCESAQGFLPETQAGFRANRATADNIFILSKLIDFAMDAGKTMILVFIDFVAAFDTVSHHFLDEAMAAATPQGVGNSLEKARMEKCRAIVRAIYKKATAAVRVTKADGTHILSSTFPVGRGVLQGDKVSPICFIMALQLIRQLHDIRGGAEVEGNGEKVKIDCLEYADDAALIDMAADHAIKRLNTLAEGAKKSADMEISIPKTETMWVKKQSAISPITQRDVQRFKENLRFECEFCGACFPQKSSLNKHQEEWCGEAERGTYEEEYAIERILEARGLPERRFYLTKWEGYPEEESTWEPARHFDGAEATVERFWEEHPELNRELPIEIETENRCLWCNRDFKLPSGLKGHQTNGCRSKPQTLQPRSRTAKTIKREKVKALQSKEEAITLFGQRLNNVYEFCYLGHLFQADGDPFHAVEVRANMAKATFGKLHEFWSSTILDEPTKLRLYKCAVWSKITYGNVAWKMTAKTRRFLNGWNGRNLSRITGKSVQEESGAHPTLNLVDHVRSIRLKWVRNILRKDANFPARRMLMKEKKPYEEGSILMDAPEHDTMWELAELARTNDKELWRLNTNVPAWGCWF